MGAVHVLELTDNLYEHLRRQNEFKTLVQANNVSIIWQLPQHIVLAFGEVLLCVTALEFVYTQAAPTMKSVLQVKTFKN
jgi:dipeptide/tripeptide permease